MRLKRGLLLTAILLILCSVSVFAANVYIKDDANVLSSSTIEKVNTNFQKLETNTGAQVRIAIVKDLGGKNVNDYINNIVKTGTSTNRYVVFLVSMKDHKNKMVVGSGLNATIGSSEINRIVSLPNSSFKNNNFDDGILQVGQAIDKDITTKAVKNGTAAVKSDGFSTTVTPNKSHVGTILLVLFIIAIIALIIFLVIKHLQKKADEDVARFAKQNGIDDSSGSGSFRSNSFNKSSSNYSNNSSSNYSSSTRSSSSGSTYSRPSSSTSHTTIINNGSNHDGFVEGMIVGEMLSDHHDHHHHHDDYSNHSYTPDPAPSSGYESGDWNSGSSSWDSSSSSSSDSSSWGSDSSSSWGSDSSSSWGSDSSSDWSSGSDSSSSDW